MSLENNLDGMKQVPPLLPPEAPNLNEEDFPGTENTKNAAESTETIDQAKTPPVPREVDDSSAIVQAETPPTADDNVNYVSLIFRDGLDMPIPDLELFVSLPSGLVCNAVSTAQGAITVPVPAKAVGQAEVKVRDATGKHQTVCHVDLAQCKNAAIIRSPKVKANLSLRPHQQALPPLQENKPAAAKSTASRPIKAAAAAAATQPAKVDTGSAWWSTNGALQHAWTWLSGGLHVSGQAPASIPKAAVVAKTLNTAGQPVTVVAGSECPNPDQLRLGRNNVYRKAIIDAAKRLGLIPQALCALMDCEAGKVTELVPKLGPDGKQLANKKGKLLTTKIRELWNANAGNAQSGAAGLTQFLSSTWLGHVLVPGRYIHSKSVANGWVRKVTKPNGQTHWAFVLADGTTTTAPYSRRNTDDNVKKCLAMRMDPTWSINAAADYGAANLQVLKDHDFKVDGLNDMDKAKLMYLMHHEGEGSGPLFIRNTLASASGGVAHLRHVFEIQLGSDGVARAAALIHASGNDVEVAYRKWFANFVDGNFSQASKYFCSQPVAVRDLSTLCELIGGEALE